MRKLYQWSSKLLGRNSRLTPSNVVLQQLNDPRPLPMGRKHFKEWTDRIIAGAMVPNEDGLLCYHDYAKATKEQKKRLDIFRESQEYVLANAIMHLGPTEDHKPDAFFIHSLRKLAANQVADTVRRELHDAAKARTAAEASEIEAKKALDEASKT